MSRKPLLDEGNPLLKRKGLRNPQGVDGMSENKWLQALIDEGMLKRGEATEEEKTERERLYKESFESKSDTLAT